MTGEAARVLANPPLPEIFAIKPIDFPGIVPKILVQEGDEVQAGSSLFYDKKREAVHFASPVSGEVIEIVRGEKRAIQEIKILTEKQTRYIDFGKSDPRSLAKEDILALLLKSGAWPFIRQRPYAIVADPEDNPKSIFITAFDSNPLAPDLGFIIQEQEHNFQTGLNAIQKLTSGKVHLNVNATGDLTEVFNNAQGVEINKVSGPHPAGNVGTQIHYIDPINKGEVVWYINPQDVIIIGKLFTEGRFDASRVVALTGPQVKNPKYFKTVVGCSIKNILDEGQLSEGDNRIISGNVLTGRHIPVDGFLGFYDAQITVIPEGHYYEFMGWLTPGLNKFSMSRTFFSWLTPNKKYILDTNMHGEERPFVMTGQYEKVFPMDIYPVHLIKSILIEDIEMMEKLGIYEVVEEDFALCEFVCTSKIKSQEIIRRGLNLIQKEFG